MSWDLTDVERKDRNLAHGIVDASEPMRRTVEIIARGIDDNFTTETAAGEPWEPLAESTIEDRRRKGYGAGPTLQRDGALRKAASAFRASDQESAGVGPDGIDYAVFHVSEEPRSKIPLRDFLAMSDERIQEIDSVIVAHLESSDG